MYVDFSLHHLEGTNDEGWRGTTKNDHWGRATMSIDQKRRASTSDDERRSGTTSSDKLLLSSTRDAELQGRIWRFWMFWSAQRPLSVHWENISSEWKIFLCDILQNQALVTKTSFRFQIHLKIRICSKYDQNRNGDRKVNNYKDFN